MRLGIKFSRTGETRFVSHLDMQRLFSRALRRTGLPVKFSQGFNPHILTSFASALSVGTESHGDYMEFYTVSDISPEEVKKKLNDVMPDGIEILKAGKIDENEEKLMAACRAAKVTIIAENFAKDAIDSGIKEILSLNECICEKKSKGKIRQFDIRPLIYNADFSKENTVLTVAHSGSGSLPPAVLIEEAKKRAGVLCETRVIREDLLIDKNGELVSMGELFCEV